MDAQKPTEKKPSPSGPSDTTKLLDDFPAPVSTYSTGFVVARVTLATKGWRQLQ